MNNYENFLQMNYMYYICNTDLISNLNKWSNISNNIESTKFAFAKYKISIIKIKDTS